MSRLSKMSMASVYPLYLAKVERKGHTQAELDTVILWLTGFTDPQFRRELDAETSFEEFFAKAQLNPKASAITGLICGIRVENIEDPLEQKIRYLDKLVDEVARGKSMAKILRP